MAPAESAGMDPEERNAIVEAAHRNHAPDAWRDLLVAERAAVTYQDVLNRLGVIDDAGLRAALSPDTELNDPEFDRLVAAVKDEIATDRAQAKLPNEVWKRFTRASQ